MNVYGTEQIRNVVLLGHGGAGKTTVAEALAMVTGVTKRMGKVFHFHNLDSSGVSGGQRAHEAEPSGYARIL